MTPEKNINPRVIALLRVSSKPKRASLERQRTVITHTVNTHNLDVIRTVTLVDVSGNNVLQHPEFQGILRAIETREVDGVVVADQDLFFPANHFESFVALDVLKMANAKLYTGCHVHDFSNMEGIFLSYMSAILRNDYRRTIIKRMQQGKEMKRQERKVMSSKTHEKLE